LRERKKNMWQSIETAPSNGKLILVCGGRYGKGTLTPADGDWWRTNDCPSAFPTYWMERPEPPKDYMIPRRNNESFS
jgi:hypothetical protein